MEQNPNLAKGFHKNTEKSTTNQQWGVIKTKLNSIGPPTREIDGWMKVWADFKTSVKKKRMHNKMESRATGGGIFKQKVLTPVEETVAALLQMDSIINPEGPTFGVANASVVDFREETYEELITDISMEGLPPSSNCNPRPSKAKEQAKSMQKYTLLEQQLKVQTDLYDDVKKSLAEIERYSRKTFKLQEEQLKLQKEKVQLYKDEIKKKDIQRSAMLKLRMEEIQLKTRKIELEELKN